MSGWDGRIPCIVPGCRRTRKANHVGDEWICEKHWRGVPKDVKRRKFVAYALWRKAVKKEPLTPVFWKLPAGSKARVRAVRLDRRCHKAWAACKAAAIEEAFMGFEI